jgi:hypothetical protein
LLSNTSGVVLSLERRTSFLEAGVVEGDIEPAVTFGRGLDQARDVVLPGHVGSDRQRLRTQHLAGCRGCPDFGLAPAGDQHRHRALSGHF